MDGACSMYKGEEKRIQGFRRNTSRKDRNWKGRAWMGR
jgi:hypothetical protein